MSIADKLTYLNGTKSLLREAINAAGGNLTQETPFREYAGGWLRDQSASLILDFSKQQYVAKDQGTMLPDRVGFEDIVTFTRSTGGGRFNAQGQYEWVGPDEPRIDYDPLTGECLGLLIEEQRTNLLMRSENLIAEYWSVTRGSVVLGTATAPDGESLAYKFVSEAGESIQRIGRFTSVAPDTTYTQSWYVKSAGVRYCSTYLRSSEIGSFNDNNTLVVDLDTGEFRSGSNIVASVVHLPDGWFRISVTGTTTDNPGSTYSVVTLVDSLALTHNPPIVGDGTSGIYIWGAQLEEGFTPSSYIPTEDARVTRAADDATVNDLAPWHSPNQGSFSIKAKGHIGEPLLTAGDDFIIADSDELKEYQLSYSKDPQAAQADIGKGLIESIRYWPRETS